MLRFATWLAAAAITIVAALPVQAALTSTAQALKDVQANYGLQLDLSSLPQSKQPFACAEGKSFQPTPVVPSMAICGSRDATKWFQIFYMLPGAGTQKGIVDAITIRMVKDPANLGETRCSAPGVVTGLPVAKVYDCSVDILGKRFYFAYLDLPLHTMDPSKPEDLVLFVQNWTPEPEPVLQTLYSIIAHMGVTLPGQRVGSR